MHERERVVARDASTAVAPQALPLDQRQGEPAVTGSSSPSDAVRSARNGNGGSKHECSPSGYSTTNNGLTVSVTVTNGAT